MTHRSASIGNDAINRCFELLSMTSDFDERYIKWKLSKNCIYWCLIYCQIHSSSCWKIAFFKKGDFHVLTTVQNMWPRVQVYCTSFESLESQLSNDVWLVTVRSKTKAWESIKCKWNLGVPFFWTALLTIVNISICYSPPYQKLSRLFNVSTNILKISQTCI